MTSATFLRAVRPPVSAVRTPDVVRPTRSAPAARPGVTAGAWYPKLGVHEPAGMHGRKRGGWAARQFHRSTEFYADFADYDVSLEVPVGFSVFATGEDERGSGAPAGRERHRFRQRAVHDFAWVAGKNLHSETHAFAPSGRGPIAVTYVTPQATRHYVPRMRRAAEATFEELARRVGSYPFSTMTVVQPAWRGYRTTGMEYPTLVTGMPGKRLFDLPGLARMRSIEGTVAHEVIRNYFQRVVAKGEQTEAYFDGPKRWRQFSPRSRAGGAVCSLRHSTRVCVRASCSAFARQMWISRQD